MTHVGIDAVAEEQTARFVRSITIANEGGAELIVGLAWRDSRRSPFVNFSGDPLLSKSLSF